MSKKKANEIICVDGFDFTHKETYIERELKNYIHYTKKNDIVSQKLGIETEWSTDSSVLDFIEQVTDNTIVNGLDVVIDGSLAKTYAYACVMKNKTIGDDIFNWFKDNEFYKDIKHIYIKHHNMASAKEIYDHRNQKGIWNSFEDYWMFYSKADYYYGIAFEKLGIKPLVLEAVPDGSFKVVEDYEF